MDTTGIVVYVIQKSNKYGLKQAAVSLIAASMSCVCHSKK